jgi:oxygen-independent coproporphyrinogen-3 oxidase
MSPPADCGHYYVHVPFCLGKCAYCGFYSSPWRPGAANRYLDALEAEFRRTLPAGRPVARTVYIGGGTPTVLNDRQLERLLGIVNAFVTGTETTEWTVEANPGTLTAARLTQMRRAGVNRVSLGVQSLDDSTLRLLGRPHTARDVATSVRLLRRTGFDQVGLDLIASLPGVTPVQWTRTLDRALALAPQHVSVYALSIEPGSRFAREARAGRLRVPSDAEQLESLAQAETRLRHAGLRRYEVSNYAVPGRECRHNLACWRGEDYVGFGPAAASRVGLHRWHNRPDTDRYTRALRAGRLPPRSRERVDTETDVSERIAFALRLREGVDLAAHAGTGPAAAARLARWTAAMADCRRHGLAWHRAGRWRLTVRGLRFADPVAERLLPDQDP